MARGGVYRFRDPVTRQAKCNVFIRQVTQAKMRQLEEKRRLEEKEHVLFLQAKKLVESEEELDFVHVIAEYYQGIYVVDLAEDQTRSIKVPRYFASLLNRADHRQSKTLELYCQEMMDPDYISAFQSVTDFENLRRSSSSGGRWSSSTARKMTFGFACGSSPCPATLRRTKRPCGSLRTKPPR